MGTRLQRRGGFVEADVPVGAKAEHQQIDAAGAVNAALVPSALRGGISRGAVQEVNAAPRQVDMVEQMPIHEGAVAARIARADADEFVEIEGRGPREVRTARAVQGDQLAVERHRRPAGRKPEHQPRLRPQRTGDHARQRLRGAVRRAEHTDLHKYAGIAAPPRASAAASNTAPIAGSSVSGCTWQRGATSSSRRPSSATSQGTTRKIPPASTNGNGSPRISSRAATELAASTSSSAARSRMWQATA